VWSAWRKPAELYLGHGVAMLRQPGAQALALEHAVTLPVAQVLQELGAMLDAAPPENRSRALRVSLGAIHSPAVGFDVPEGVRGPAEVEAIALGACAQAMQCPADELKTSVNWAGAQVAAPVTAALLEALQQWCRERRLRLGSVRPLWAAASDCEALRSIRVRATVVHEPGAVTFLAEDPALGGCGSTVVETQDQARQLAMRWSAGLGLDDAAIAAVRLHPQARDAWPQGPHAWLGHWSRP
jgi:hypothetical protein